MQPLLLLGVCFCFATADINAAPAKDTLPITADSTDTVLESPVAAASGIPVSALSVSTAPADTAATPTFGIVNLSVATLCVAPDFSSEPVTQALLGMPVKILDRQNWYLVRLPDDYTAWVHPAAVCPVAREALEAWNAAPKVVVTAHAGTVYARADARSQPLSDVVASDRLKWEGTVRGYYRVAYPDGRAGYLPKALALPEARWRQRLTQDALSIIRTAFTFTGVPYIWAGTSPKGMDCSGFIRTVLYMHDIIIPRDASRQALKGEPIDIASDCSNLQPGDLLFFGTKAQGDTPRRVVHVGMYIGGKRFIHSQGDVHVGSLDAQDALFDAFNFGRLLFATRFLPYIDKEDGLNTTATNPYYQSPLPASLLESEEEE
ncbi:MAG: C40 family peptidase [Prevotellaceae bacterium]|nr:C40 family peptidase [Prevotellaceae bacterium]